MRIEGSLKGYARAHTHTHTHTHTPDTTPPKEVLKSGRITFIEAGFVPAAIVHVGVESSDAPPPVLSQDSLQQAQSGLEAEVIVAKKRELKQLRPCMIKGVS